MARRRTTEQVVGMSSATLSQGPTQEIPISALEQRPSELQQQIRELAYQLYEQRGRADGNAQQDWIQAEAIILGRKEKLAA